MNKHWSVRLGDVASTVMGQAPPGTACNTDGEGTVFVKAGEFSDRLPVVREWTTRPLKMARVGDVLVCVVGATAGKINLAIDCAIGRSVAAVRPETDRLDTGYLHHFLSTRVMFLRRKSQGLAQGVITRDMLEELELPLPPLDEQREIAAILDEADALRQKRRRAITLLDSLTQSIFVEMFGDTVVNSRQLPFVDLASLEGFLTSGSRGWAKYYAPTGRAFIRIQNLKAGELDTGDLAYVQAPDGAESRRTTVREDDVLISITADLGRVAVVPSELDGRGNINQHLALLRPRGVDSVYLAHYLASPGGQRQFASANKGGVKAGLNFDDVRGLKIPLPALPEQQHFRKAVHHIQNSKRVVAGSLASIQDLFSSLQHRAFSGQL